jgi:hypothetical protein
VVNGPTLTGMEPELPEPPPEPDYRHLPPRITPDEMVETKPVLRLYEDWPAGTEDERALRTSAG